MYPRFLLAATGLAAFLCGLILFAPLPRLASWLPESSPLRVATFEGTLGEGRATLPTSMGATVWHFRLQPLYLLTLGMGGRWEFSAADAVGEGTAVVRPWGGSANISSGKIAASRLVQLAGGDAFQAAEPLFLKDISVRAKPGAGLVSVEGQLSWGPGQVQLRNRAQPVAVPLLSGQLATADGAIHLKVGDASSPEDSLLDAVLTLEDRQLHVTVPGRAMRVLGLSSKFADDKPAFEMKQSLR